MILKVICNIFPIWIDFQQQLAQSIADQQQSKSELPEQLQFSDQIDNVVIEEDISEFVTYNEDDQLDVNI